MIRLIYTWLILFVLLTPAYAATITNPGGSGGGLASTDINTSSKLSTILTDETGTGAAVFGTAPTLDSPVITNKILLPRVTALPGTPTTGDTVIVTDDSATGACDSAAGSAVTLCQYNGAAWAALGDGATEADTLQTVFARGKSVTGANSEANCLRIGDGTNYSCLFWDATDGWRVTSNPIGSLKQWVPTNQNYVLWDQEGAAAIETIDPDAATKQGIYTYGSAYRPLKSAWLSAGALSTDGTQCAAPAEVTINSGAKMWTIICADNDASTIYGALAMPDSWDGGTVTLMGSFIQTAADTSNMNSDVAMACRVDGDTVDNTWGTEIAMDTAMGGSNKIDTVTTAAITPNGTCTGAGTLLQFRWQLDATGTTTAVATLHVLGFKLVYVTKSRSD